MNKELFTRILSSLILIPIVFFLIHKGSIFFNIFILTIFLITIYEWHYLSFKKAYYLPGFIFVIFSFYTFYFLRNENDYNFFLLILLICVATDIGGYIFGNIFKGPKIYKKISPNKTYAGSIGGFLLSILLVYIFSKKNFIISDDIPNQFGKDEFLFILIISTVSQIGDFIISFFKRKAKKKNTGSIIPGHGGLLDRIDGMIFALPFAYMYFNLF